MYELMDEWLRNSLRDVEGTCWITSPNSNSCFFLSVGRTIDELSISAPPTPYYFFYAHVSCRVCIVPKCAKAMEYLSSWA